MHGRQSFGFDARDGHDWGDAGWTRASGSWSFAFCAGALGPLGPPVL